MMVLLEIMTTGGQVRAAEVKPGVSVELGSSVSQVVLEGKLSCSVKRQVALPFKGIVTSLLVRVGQKVQTGDVLARYRLAADVVMQLRRRFSTGQINDLEVRLAEIEKNVGSLEGRHHELNQLLEHSMAPAEALKQVKREMRSLKEQQLLLQERIRLEKELAKEDLMLATDLLGEPVTPTQVPKEASLISPIDGYVIGIHPELREDVELGPISPAFSIGVMEPMIMRAHVHEMEAFELSMTDSAEITVESLRGRKFDAKVSRISWTPLTPALEQPSYYEIELAVPNPDLALKDGMKGKISLPAFK